MNNTNGYNIVGGYFYEFAIGVYDCFPLYAFLYGKRYADMEGVAIIKNRRDNFWCAKEFFLHSNSYRIAVQ